MATRIGAAATPWSLSNFDAGEGWPAVTRTNVVYLVIGALSIAVAVLSYQL
jgi:hypothetical protein